MNLKRLNPNKQIHKKEDKKKQLLLSGGMLVDGDMVTVIYCSLI